MKSIAAIRLAARELVRELGCLTQPFSAYGLSLSQCHTLIELEMRGKMNISQLSDLLNLERSSVSRLVKILQDHQLILTQIDPNDGRSKILQLTDNGYKLLKNLHDEFNKRIAPALEQLSEIEYNYVLKGLSIYAVALRNSRVINSRADRIDSESLAEKL